jgi:post-segregation antitoxin (ccd killing protein)
MGGRDEIRVMCMICVRCVTSRTYDTCAIVNNKRLLLTKRFVFCSISTTMNTATGYARLNITLPKDVAEYVRKNTANISKYISETIRERMTRERRLRAMKALQQLPPAFPDIKDATTYVRELRAEDTKRDKRLGLV